MKKDSILYVVVFTFVISAIFVTGLALANEGTKDRVAANRELTSQAAVLGALGISYGNPDEAKTLYAAAVTPIADASPRAYRATVDGSSFLAVEQSGAGLWGTITVIVAADPAGDRIRGVQVVSQNETPGLGGRIEESWFLDQFRNEASAKGIKVTSGAESKGTGDVNPDNGLVDGITGASRTSSAFESIINAALARVRAVAGGAL
ncbi:MAG: FMN-binding protein [Spirochaetales bacterium]|nr:MAG: FMN-binding protein [Spirochaetales bacterium]